MTAAKIRTLHTVAIKLHTQAMGHENEPGSEGKFTETVHVFNANNADEAIWYVKQWAQGLDYEHPDTGWKMKVIGAKTVSVRAVTGLDEFRLVEQQGAYILLVTNEAFCAA